jgi:tripartite ATP-independent transporter DctM subunit
MIQFFIVTAILIGTILMGIPIAFAIGLATIIYFFMTMPQYIHVIPLRMFSGVDSFVLMALPLFVLAAEIMVKAGISDRLFNFVRLLIGRVRGGLAYVNVFASTVFGSISGAALSDVAGLGKVEIEAMCEEGYKKDFSCALTAASALQSPLIPPSNIALVYGGLMSISIGALFLAGVIPGLLLAGSQVVYIALNAKRMNMPKVGKKYSKAEIFDILKNGLVALVMPLIILGGILSGVVTPVEAAGLAVFYAIAVGLLVYRNVGLRVFMDALWSSVKTSASLFVIIAFATTFSWALSMQHVPDQIAESMLRISSNPLTLLFIVNILMIIVGMWLDPTPALILFVPVLAPIMHQLGVHPVHFAIVMILNLMVGGLTPPVGLILYAVTAVGKIKFEELVKACLPFIVVSVIVLALVTYFPELTLFMPRLFGFI